MEEKHLPRLHLHHQNPMYSQMLRSKKENIAIKVQAEAICLLEAVKFLETDKFCFGSVATFVSAEVGSKM